ncbi:MAG: hypothetical protein ACYS9X_18165, partial [Planctomycetota bacterium]
MTCIRPNVLAALVCAWLVPLSHAAIAQDENPDAKLEPSAPVSEVEAACAQLEKIAGTRSFVATYELWRVGMAGRIPFELVYTTPDMCLLFSNDPRLPVKYYSSKGRVYACIPGGKTMALNFREIMVAVLEAISNACREREELHRTWGWEH